ncbi:MAG: hypothetical protein ACLRL4_04450 [Bifidobacterium bifidum]
MAVASNGEQTVVSVIEATRCGWSTPNIRSTAFTGDKGVIVFPRRAGTQLISSQMSPRPRLGGAGCPEITGADHREMGCCAAS